MASHPPFPRRTRVPVPTAEFCLPAPVNSICGENVWITAGFALTLKREEHQPGINVSSPVVSTKAKAVQPPQELSSAGDSDVEDLNKDNTNKATPTTTGSAESKKTK
ncbi:hypothetical protein H310_08174 [Aphanomyces invadans]|uniref:Uncharacterized protein n=1 Tax=Aphanomyces invadans TaxID=157072 RepID=A0A024TZB6_9STRA|nr:hypothetical protein H310_08174 [Aphanomyces invadans]ETV99500.1 hypothetical protein H310_08174 [Aphanomyces invadans]|eukprot:XP_008872056.1 hypothetical protein H310_08174 [Aphanomyces invadans]